VSIHTDPISKPIPFGLSLTAGAGLILMILALGFGVVQGANANSTAIGLTFAGGLGLLIIGVVGWLATVQPFNHFDDINVPMYTGHHDPTCTLTPIPNQRARTSTKRTQSSRFFRMAKPIPGARAAWRRLHRRRRGG